MARVETVLVSSTKAYEATGPDGSIVTVKNLGPDSCVFATASTVSAGSNDGTLTSGSSLTFAPSKFFLSSGTSNLQVSAPVGDQFRQYDADQSQPGLIAPSTNWLFAASTTVAANRGYVCRFVPTRAMTITKIAYGVSTAAGSDDAVDVGIYDSSLAKLVSSGATTGQLNSTGTKAITVTATTLKAGAVYYAALSVGTLGGTAAVISGAAATSLFFVPMFGATFPFVDFDVKASVHPLPTSWGAVGGVASTTALLAVRES